MSYNDVFLIRGSVEVVSEDPGPASQLKEPCPGQVGFLISQSSSGYVSSVLTVFDGTFSLLHCQIIEDDFDLQICQVLFCPVIVPDWVDTTVNDLGYSWHDVDLWGFGFSIQCLRRKYSGQTVPDRITLLSWILGIFFD